MYSKGKLTTWDDERGFGFITPNDGSNPIFIHAKGFYYKNKRPMVNQLIAYTISQDKNGRNFATEVGFNTSPKSKKTPYKIKAATLIFPSAFIFFIGFMVLITELPMLVLYYYIILSLITFFVYRIDKISAKDGRSRTPENTLHILALFGGWPGALIAQQKFRHKTQKISFLVKYWITVMINCTGLIWLITPQGLNNLNVFINNLN